MLKKTPLESFPPASAHWSYRVLYPSFVWSQLAFPLNLMFSMPKPDLLFSLSHYSPRFTGIPSVVSVMDLSFLHYPQMFKKSDYYKLKNWTAFSVKKARKIITISNFTKGEIIKFYKIDPGRIIMAYPGVDRNIYRPSKTPSKKDFILFVGTLQPRKNISGLLTAFSNLNQKDKLHLKIVGKKGWLYKDIFEMVKKKGLEKKVLFSDYASEKDLISYYQNALCLVLPSLYEGFGIPVIEAFACGCPVIAANSSSLPEIVGNAGLLVNALNPGAITRAIDRISADKGLSRALIKSGITRSESFNWENTARIIYTTLTDSKN